MVVSQIEIIEDVGGGQTRVTERRISTTEFAVKIDGQLYRPAVTTQVEIENDGDVSTTTDQCGNTERDREANQGWSVRVQGIVTGNDDRGGNLSMQLLRDVIATADTIKVRSDVTGSSVTRLEVSNTVITQASDLVSIQTADTNGEEQAFEFNLQLGESEADN
jgi:hypothetical protein